MQNDFRADKTCFALVECRNKFPFKDKIETAAIYTPILLLNKLDITINYDRIDLIFP